MRLLTELFVFLALWALWDFRVAATFALVGMVLHAIQAEHAPKPPAPAEPPTLREPVEAPQRPRG